MILVQDSVILKRHPVRCAILATELDQATAADRSEILALDLNADGVITLDELKEANECLEDEIPSGVAENVLTITIKTLVQSIQVTARNADTIADVKTKIADKEGISPARQRLVFEGKQLWDTSTVYYSGIKQNSTVILTLRVLQS